MDSRTSENNSIVRHGSRLTVLTLLSRVTGLVREMVKAALLGTTVLSDAWTNAFIIPNLLRRLFAEGSISVAFVPTFKRILMDGKDGETREFLSSFFTILSFFVTAVVLLGMLCAPLIVPFFTVEEVPETVLLTRIMFPYLAFVSFAALMQGILNGAGVFSPSGFTPILLNFSVIGFTFLFAPHTANYARSMALGVLIGGSLQFLFQLPFVLKKGFRFSLIPLKRAFANPGTRTVFKLIAPTVIGMAAYQMNEAVSTALAGRAGEGVLSSINYSLRLQELILGVFAVSIGTVMLPHLTVSAKNEAWAEFDSRLTGSINAITLITVPIAFFAFFSAENIVSLVYEGLHFNRESVELTAYAFRFHLLGLFFIAQNRVIAPAFYARQDAKSPTLAGILSFALNIGLALALVGPMKGGGIALALSVASGVNTILLLVLLGRKEGTAHGVLLGATGAYLAKIVLFSVLSVLPVVLLRGLLYGAFADAGNKLIRQGIPLVLSTLMFAAVGVPCLLATRDPQLASILGMLGRRFGKKNGGKS